MVTSAEVRAAAKPRDSWWTVLLVDPIALRLARWSAQFRWATPNRITLAAFAVTLVAAAAFAQGSRWWLVGGALAYYVSFLFDCVDGKVARLTGKGSAVGQWLDFMLDRIGVTICAAAIFGAQYQRTDEPWYLAVGAVVVFLNLLHQLNGQIMEGALREARRVAEGGVSGAAAPGASEAAARPGALDRLRAALARRRIRGGLFSAIEFQMALFIVGPLCGYVLPVAIAACVLLLLFDVAHIVRFVAVARALRHQATRTGPPLVADRR